MDEQTVDRLLAPDSAGEQTTRHGTRSEYSCRENMNTCTLQCGGVVLYRMKGRAFKLGMDEWVIEI